MSNAKEISTAQAPFDNPECDIILRSTDSVDFHVFKLILSLVSPVFKDMFTLPLPQTDCSIVSAVPVIPMAETSTTLNSLLLLCYPATVPTFNSLEDGKAVLEAAMKYDMGVVLSRATDIVMAQFISINTLELYALSCKFGWKHHAQTAATEALTIKNLGRPTKSFTGMRDITALDYSRLLDYHYNCGTPSYILVGSLKWLEPSNELKDMCMWKCGNEGATTYNISNLGVRLITPWFEEYLVSCGRELFERPCKSTLYDSESYDRAMGKAVGCSNCRTKVFKDMAKFRTLLAAEFEKMVADRRLETD